MCLWMDGKTYRKTDRQKEGVNVPKDRWMDGWLEGKKERKGMPMYEWMERKNDRKKWSMCLGV